MALQFETKKIEQGKKTTGAKKRALGNGYETKCSGVLGVIKVTTDSGKRKITVFVGADGESFRLSKTRRGLSPFSGDDALNAAMRAAIKHISAVEKPFDYLSKLSTQ